MQFRTGLAALAVILSSNAAAARAPQPRPKVIARIDLSKPFHLPSPATFTASQGPDVDDPTGFEGDKAPGLIHLCLRLGPEAPCSPDLDDVLKSDSHIDLFSTVHYLETANIVYPHGAAAPALFHLQMASFHAGNGSQIHAAVMLAYRPLERRFDPIFQEQFGGNMNQEARYIDTGKLKGAMVLVRPTDNAPYGYWVDVHRLSSDYRYKQVLRYRSVTRYNDGNQLAVIDSEMPNILRRLGLWRLGRPLPLPQGKCPKPRLEKMELCCS